MGTLDGVPAGYLVADSTFFNQSIGQQTIDLSKPDALLLEVALFQATNEARRKAGLPLFQYDRALSQAARSHAQSMIQYDFYGHENPVYLWDRTLLSRVRRQTTRFGRMAENIGEYQTINTPKWFSVRFSSRHQRYEYFSEETSEVYSPYGYASYARYAVEQWLKSPHHRANLLNPLYTHLGCAASLSAHPFQSRRIVPFGRLVQNFGALKEPITLK
ncbi:CAP domain-containing protein [Fibrella forsythiae]|uniref:CAP domain-containing protein n=1 Tax=Fibrella forsythiae TaxID=2817061 RepID=A0ABS3JS64_9BACT|nr:CAP domain-containing protein [Fibrella forsythiae]MBO0952851.1 CAP domain-containing protein [Fibrella forsythiae]